MAPQFMYLVMRERRCYMLEFTEVCPIAAYLDKGMADAHAEAVQDAVARALDELQSYRQAPAPHIVMPLDPTCPLDDDTNVGYSVQAVPLVGLPLGSEGLHPWMLALHSPAEGAADKLQSAIGAALARLKQGSAPAVSA
ncbi:hypothetical protein AB4Y45_34200 [Paraburkholderia sp. EG287A]|uniref:hypothetical protein n=1 Tax=Paraburkholderia sp. EG287A TaxID=3237012 RepID=UPI0034D32B03